MIKYIRLLLSTLYFLLISLLSFFIFLLRPCSAKNIWLFARSMSLIPILLGLKIIIRGRKNLLNKPCVFICNHQNSFDFLTGVCIAPPNTVSIGKKSLRLIPLFGQLYWLAGNILIDRSSARKAYQTMQDLRSRIHKEQLSIWIFPEGTRNYGKGLLPFKNGGFKLAMDLKIPIVPICIATYDIDLKRLWKSGRLVAEILPPVDSDTTLEELKNKCFKMMTNGISKLDQECSQTELP